MQTPSRLSVDTEWFRQKIQDRGLSQAKVARKIGLDPGAFSLMMTGSPRRKWHLHHVEAIAPVLGVSMAEVMEHLGIEAPLHGALSPAPRKTPPVQLVGSIEASGVVAPAAEQRVVQNPPAGGFAAFRTEAFGVPAVLFAETATPAAECIGRLCLIDTGEGRQVVRRLARGLFDGTFDLHPWIGNGPVETDVRLSKVHPIGWAKL